ncbi:MAG TPA: dihydrodipicolinate synthase family protein, partial [Thermomicrobiales bacterium]|nr:dihydrodipicolinate synthase family protein [Thermomicrobiales bacterium]
MAVPLRAGVHSVVATPFLPDESLDLASIDTLVDACARAGCDGLLVLGVLGEADRLSDIERDRVVARFLDRAGDDLQITVGVTHPSTVVTRERARA